MFSYRVGFPGWKIAARLGVMYDSDAKVFVAWSDDFSPDFGCVAESPTWEGLQKELGYVFDDAFDVIFDSQGKEPKFEPVLLFATA